MNRFLTLILIVSIIGNLLGLVVLYKAFDYRKKMQLAWAQSHEWVSEYNKKVPAHAQDTQNPSLVFMGASITAHWDLAKFFPNRPYVNKGIDGQYAGHLLLRFQHDVIDLHPYGVVIKFCEMNFAHDVPFEISRDNMIMMATLAKANNIKPILASVLPVSKAADKKEGKASINYQVHVFNQWLTAYAKQNQLTLVDFASAMSDENGCLRAELAYDGVHPNEQGYQIMTKLLDESLNHRVDQ
ncbi:MAG: hypothetical protein ALAOOOJD_03964 [bacterium]|nr:hypothetical protein [bacterium]